MAFKLTKAQQKELADHLETLQRKRGALETAEHARSEGIAALDAAVADALKDFNGALSDAKTFVETTAEEFRSAYDEKSERWQEGDKGQAASAFVDAWEEPSMEEIDESETVVPDEVEVNEIIDALEALPSEADEV